MNCKPGDLAYVVVPQPFLKTIDKKFVTVLGASGHCDLDTMGGKSVWLVNFHVPWFDSERTNRTIYQCYVRDSWLRPIRDNPGNEQFVTEARKKAPWARKTEITERGEIA